LDDFGRCFEVAERVLAHFLRLNARIGDLKRGSPDNADKHVKEIKRQTRRKFSAEEKIRIVLDGLRGESSISELCRREGIAESLYYNWSKEFLEAGKKRLSWDTARQATSGEVTSLKRETRDLKEALAETLLENRLLKKSRIADGDDAA
jgi:transposase